MAVSVTLFTGVAHNLQPRQPTQLYTGTTKCNNGLLITADSGNTKYVFVGASSSITAGSGVATDGYPMYPGKELFFPVRHPDSVYIVSDVSGQRAWYSGT